MVAIVDACNELSALVESSDYKDWPVLHVPLHANTFPLAYVYSCLLLNRGDKTPVAGGGNPSSSSNCL